MFIVSPFNITPLSEEIQGRVLCLGSHSYEAWLWAKAEDSTPRQGEKSRVSSWFSGPNLLPYGFHGVFQHPANILPFCLSNLKWGFVLEPKKFLVRQLTLPTQSAALNLTVFKINNPMQMTMKNVFYFKRLYSIIKFKIV